MSEDTIKVRVDDWEIDRAIAKAKQLVVITSNTFGTPDLSKGTKEITTEFSDFMRLLNSTEARVPDLLQKFGSTDLPGINRELRLILGQIPGMNTLIAQYFRLKRIQRSVGVAVEETVFLREMVSNPQFILTMVATLILVIKSIATYFERLKRERIAYEEFLRREKGLSKREFDTLRASVGEKETAGPGRGVFDQYYWSTPG